MTIDECLAWVSRRIDAFLPVDGMARGDAVSRLRGIKEAARQAERGAAFGFSFPADIRAESMSRTAPLFRQALATWDRWLEANDPMHGKDTWEKPAAVVWKRDLDIADGVSALRARLCDTKAATAAWAANGRIRGNQEHGFAFAAPALTELTANVPELPAAVLSLYGEIGGLWVSGVEPPGGERAFVNDCETYVLAPFASLIELWQAWDRDDEMIALNTDQDSFFRILISPHGETIYAETKLDARPRPVARSLVEYLAMLCDSYGRPPL